ncbi:Pmp3 domain-containing protein [Rhizoctonia solani AG-1 IA]|uniref:Pmp3 domain-containing protein n=1 Tax=Thanatephorus cucumeris (strain AG1-IA) TaxID=983506 RepID=L8WG33_THACA|nr:Pmp3 domain-containing protein [Rhizoctonia solani AG-1 IA]
MINMLLCVLAWFPGVIHSWLLHHFQKRSTIPGESLRYHTP